MDKTHREREANVSSVLRKNKPKEKTGSGILDGTEGTCVPRHGDCFTMEKLPVNLGQRYMKRTKKEEKKTLRL